MSLDAIKKIAQSEESGEGCKAAAEAEARRIVADAEREGLALLQQVRQDAAECGERLMQEAEKRAAQKTDEIAQATRTDCDALRQIAASHLEEAAEFIAGRVVSR